MSDDPVRHPRFLELYEDYLLGEMSYEQLWQNLDSVDNARYWPPVVTLAQSSRDVVASLQLAIDRLEDENEKLKTAIASMTGAPQRVADRLMSEAAELYGAFWDKYTVSGGRIVERAALASSSEPSATAGKIPPHEEAEAQEGQPGEGPTRQGKTPG